jgi:hypothetical protein
MRRMRKMSKERCAECDKPLMTVFYEPYCKKCFNRLYREAIAYLGKADRLSMPKKDLIEFYLAVKKAKKQV